MMRVGLTGRNTLFAVCLAAVILGLEAAPLMTSENLLQYMQMMDQMLSLLATRETVSGFGRLVLCNGSYGGKEHFVRALRKKMCDIEDDFIWRFAGKLCKENGPLLDDWVSQTFDMNGDGIISNLEKTWATNEHHL